MVSEDRMDRIIIFNTQNDTKVDDEICNPLKGNRYDIAENLWPEIPEGTHPNCRCFYVQQSTGEIVGDISSVRTFE